MSKTAFILGGGPRVGKSLANALLEHGYKVAIGRRNPDSTGLSSGIKTVKLDLSDMSSITNAFSEVKSALGVPNVVIYNAAALHAVGDRADPFSTDTEFLVKDTEVNIFGVYTALQEAVKGFKSVGEGLPKTFIATGNILPFAPVSFLYSLGVGKAGAAHLIQSALKTEAYATAGFRFYFASEVTKEGGPVYSGLSGEAHAKKYIELIDQREQGPWDIRFAA